MHEWLMFHNPRRHKSLAYRLRRMKSSPLNKIYPRDTTAATFSLHFYGRRYLLAGEDYAFWREAAAGRWEHRTFKTLQRYVHADSIYVDVGAWMGPTVLFAAPRCKQAYAIEPDPAAYERLLINLRLNAIKNVFTFHGALANANTTVAVGSERGLGKSVTRIGGGTPATQVTVLAMDLKRFIDWWQIPRIDFLKMDVEGAEFDLTDSLLELTRKFKPAIHLSTHAPFFPPAERPALLARVAKLAAQYKFCYDTKLNAIQPDTIAGDPQFTQKFGAVTLTDEAW